ncbi:MAG: site-2 protease family protein [Clostridia bacterium]|nr:site-2 protease family protein [Clostridia bacterium]
MNISNIWNNFWPYAIAVLLFLVLIIIHEFGHFIAAKSLGIRVNEFAVGFGHKLFSFKKGETLYRVNLIPLGGYCAMEGEDEASADSRAFCNKSPIRRFAVVAMGAIFNLLLGVILVAVTLIPQDRFATTQVAGFYENAVSEQSGLKAGDKIVAVNGRRIYSEMDLSYAFTNVKDGKLDLTVKRNGEKKELKDVTFATEDIDGINYISVDFYVAPQKKTFFTFLSKTGETSLSYCTIVWRSLVDLITGKFGKSSWKAMSGPVGLTAAIGNIARQRLFDLIPIMALITINLGLFNLLPLPALDGGRLLFILIEMITRKKVPQKYEALVHGIGFALLLALMVLITAKDIWGLIAG